MALFEQAYELVGSGIFWRFVICTYLSFLFFTFAWGIFPLIVIRKGKFDNNLAYFADKADFYDYIYLASISMLLSLPVSMWFSAILNDEHYADYALGIEYINNSIKFIFTQGLKSREFWKFYVAFLSSCISVTFLFYYFFLAPYTKLKTALSNFFESWLQLIVFFFCIVPFLLALSICYFQPFSLKKESKNQGQSNPPVLPEISPTPNTFTKPKTDAELFKKYKERMKDD